MKGKNLGPMRPIVFPGCVGEILLQMGGRGDRATMVRGALGVRQDQHEVAATSGWPGAIRATRPTDWPDDRGNGTKAYKNIDRPSGQNEPRPGSGLAKDE
jgi:hypothetical protein